jgi:serine/threonine protein kinase
MSKAGASTGSATKEAAAGGPLAALRAVCAAVHYAHQNLVIHRDLKPANILVTPEGSKLLDFGIAKLLKAEYASQTVGLTRTEMQPMTPEYASPNKSLGGRSQPPPTSPSASCSTGLAGRHPFQETRSRSTNSRPRFARYRPAGMAPSPPATSWLFAGDLDNIVLMAMRKSRNAVTPPSSTSPEDIRRYLENRPVMACRDTLAYRFRSSCGGIARPLRLRRLPRRCSLATVLSMVRRPGAV